MIKTNIKMRVTPEQSRRVQDICFENGISWIASGKQIKYLDEPCLVIEDDVITYRSNGLESLNISNFTKEIDADLFIKTNGTCEETFESLCNDFINENMKPYQCRCVMTPITTQKNDKFKKLKKSFENLTVIELQKKIENLHIALEKKIEKNKNQALGITRLLEQKEDLKKVIDLNNRYIKELQSNLSIFADSSKESEKMFVSQINFMTEAHKLHTDTIKEECQSKLKEKNTIISYLESKLK